MVRDSSGSNATMCGVTFKYQAAVYDTNYLFLCRVMVRDSSGLKAPMFGVTVKCHTAAYDANYLFLCRVIVQGLMLQCLGPLFNAKRACMTQILCFCVVGWFLIVRGLSLGATVQCQTAAYDTNYVFLCLVMVRDSSRSKTTTFG